MKHFLLLTGIVLFLLGQNTVYAQVYGTYPKNNVTLSLLRITGAGVPDTLETVTTNNGRFRFTTRPQEAGIYSLVLHDVGWDYPMLLEKGKNKILVSETRAIRLENTKLQRQIKACGDELKKLNEELVFVVEQLRQEKDANKQQALKEKHLNLEEQVESLLARYIQANKNNMAGLFLVWNKMNWVDFQKLENRYQLLDENMQNTPIGKAINKEIDRLWYLKPGIVARDFTMPDTAGNPVTLSTIKAKVKILDFWASWCVPCRAANKRLIPLYEKYKDQGLEIIGISVDRNAAQWKMAIKKDACGWIQLSELKATPDTVYLRYKVTRIPRWFVLDENNRCIATGNDDEGLEEIVIKELKR